MKSSSSTQFRAQAVVLTFVGLKFCVGQAVIGSFGVGVTQQIRRIHYPAALRTCPSLRGCSFYPLEPSCHLVTEEGPELLGDQTLHKEETTNALG